MSSHRIAWLVLPAVLSACATRTQAVSTEGVFHRSEAPRVVDADGSHETTWDYLVTKYDANGDGSVTVAEYDRGAEAFARHDRNGDGLLSYADYDPEALKLERERQRTLDRARPVLARYFQDDDDPDRLDVAELERALAAYDAAGDGSVTYDEFEAHKDARSAHGKSPDGSATRRLENGDPYEYLFLAADTDKDGSMTNAELVAYFHALAGDDGRAPGRAAPASGPAQGEWAPDFTLRRLEEEGSVTLSSFAGDRPVALVFGSYT